MLRNRPQRTAGHRLSDRPTSPLTASQSADGEYRLNVIPREVSGGLEYFTDKVDGQEPAGQRPGGQDHARGVFERRDGRAWLKVWDARLINEISPTATLVTKGGRHVVTFDNWYSTGLGENVVVIYRGDGSLVRSMQLSDILPEDYLLALPRSVSSL